MAEPAYDIFVSYAHADDEIPIGARNRWVTTLVEELNKVLRRMLGGSGARIWMDHQLAANVNVLDTLLATLRGSRILLLVMSPGYHQSEWCQRELGNFLAQYAAEKHKDNVFVVDLQPVPREVWHSALQALTPMRFWERGFTDKAPRPLGFPVPKLDEDNPYWRNVNELAHLIAEYLRQHAARPPESRAAILLAEATEDLLDHRDAVAVFLRQQGVECCHLPTTLAILARPSSVLSSATSPDLWRLSSYLDPMKGGDRQTTPPRLWYCRQIRPTLAAAGGAHPTVAHAKVSPNGSRIPPTGNSSGDPRSRQGGSSSSSRRF